MILKDKKALVCGMAKSGISAVELLLKRGAKVTLQDLKTEAQLDKIAAAQFRAKGVTL